MSTPPDPTTLANIQGHIIGFNKDHMRLVFLQFGPDAAQSKAFIAAMATSVATGEEVLAFNDLFKRIRGRRPVNDEGVVESTWLNFAISAAGLRAIGNADVDSFPPTFVNGMTADAPRIGDTGRSDPTTWSAPFNAAGSVHAVAIVAADTPVDLEAGYQQLQTLAASHGLVELGVQNGNTRPAPNRGNEHFGFKDGVSQPSIAGLTVSSKADGQPPIAAGEFLIGHPDQDSNTSGQPPTATPPTADGYPGAPPTQTPPTTAPLPAWATDGSFLVYRRLQQDVAAFNAFRDTQAPPLGLTPPQLEAKLMGRWPSGAPMVPTTGTMPATDPSQTDPSQADQGVLDDERINAFDYDQDPDGLQAPRASHIRKTNPRSQLNGGRPESDRHRILRRGIPYGTDFAPGETAYGSTPPSDSTDRGLLFLCFQSSIDRGFAFIQQAWANAPDFPQAGDGHDPIISQNIEPRAFSLPPNNPHVAISQWVTTRGGEYFFAPSISALQTLSA